jgi:hypothetical protein
MGFHSLSRGERARVRVLTFWNSPKVPHQRTRALDSIGRGDYARISSRFIMVHKDQMTVEQSCKVKIISGRNCSGKQ